MFNHPKSIITLLAVASFTAVTAASAQEAVHWDATDGYVAAWRNGTGLSAGSVGFSDTIARSPDTETTDYTGGTYYGGAISDGTNGIQWFRVGTSYMDFGGYTQENGDALTAIYIWDQSDFLNGYDTGSVSITSLSAELSSAGSSQSQGYVRWLIEVGDTYYVSDSFEVAYSTVTSYSLDDLLSVSWYSITPSTSMTTISGTAWGAEDFSSVTAVGLWYQVVDERTSLSGDQSAFGRITSFSATAIPEPSAYAMSFSGLALLATLAVRRTRRK